ncbi:MAG TPA: MraY family glycosyltransferase [Gammaproteobacteria bacterium]|nr:MraY family glycosyltransferase [Gammaproteobacteria bacterium]
MNGLFNEFGLISIFITSLLLALLLMPAMRYLAMRFHIIDVPGERKVHENEVPLLGGLAFALAFILAALLFVELTPIHQALLAGLVIILITGLVDDIRHLNPYLKFAGEILASLVFLLAGGVAITSFGDLVGSGPLTTGRYAIPVSVFCMVGVMNAINMMDGLDGLAGGVSLIGTLFLAWFAFVTGQSLHLGLLVALAGGLLGFLYFNRYPARIFMGDTGSLVLGYLLSALCIAMVQPVGGQVLVLPVSMAIIMGLPIVDAMLLMSVRILHGKNPFKPDKTHLHDRLQRLGFNHPRTVHVIYAMMATCGLLAVLVRHAGETQQFVAGAIYACLLFGSVYLLNYLTVKRV